MLAPNSILFLPATSYQFKKLMTIDLSYAVINQSSRSLRVYKILKGEGCIEKNHAMKLQRIANQNSKETRFERILFALCFILYFMLYFLLRFFRTIPFLKKGFFSDNSQGRLSHEITNFCNEARVNI